ncbi:PQ loop repeat-domain-containing protein [Protomyces lactucae-debilis]|uniref:PQ loop repeat-domain-containing protein n=1 Tax=Protomyces lactucae-debilis TaxID=2754530 RepID=A0A1Y2FJT7_PROLT|nr:PQ loop repeat-domain-containing protein [Protomyces lactucae-debilis]ORY84223.1 PQ loop repeat-domain-containing protein [Protomyces lactucae-debilis]
MDALYAAPRGCSSQDEFGQFVSPIIERLTGECVYGSQAAFSWTLGYLSLLFWIQAQFPQLVLNFQRQSASALSPTFLAVWMIGDVANLIGCILTHQLPFQTLLASYYCFIDGFLVLQYIMYSIWQPDVAVLDGIVTDEHSPPPRKWYRSAPNNMVVVAALVSSVDAATGSGGISAGLQFGQAAAWLSSILYFLSRIPQIRANYKRSSTEGLSAYLFLAAFCGNLCYSLSVLTSPHATTSPSNTAEEARAFLLGALPFLIGSGGTLMFDLVIVVQALVYRPRQSWRDWRLEMATEHMTASFTGSMTARSVQTAFSSGRGRARTKSFGQEDMADTEESRLLYAPTSYGT